MILKIFPYIAVLPAGGRDCAAAAGQVDKQRTCP